MFSLSFSHHSVLWMDHLFNLLQFTQHWLHSHPHRQQTLQGWLHSNRWVHQELCHTVINWEGVRWGRELNLLSVSAASHRHLIMRSDPSDYSKQQSVTNFRLNFCTEMTKEGVIKHPEVINLTKSLRCWACNWVFSYSDCETQKMCLFPRGFELPTSLQHSQHSERLVFLLYSLYFKQGNVAHFHTFSRVILFVF